MNAPLQVFVTIFWMFALLYCLIKVLEKFFILVRERHLWKNIMYIVPGMGSCQVLGHILLILASRSETWDLMILWVVVSCLDICLNWWQVGYSWATLFSKTDLTEVWQFRISRPLSESFEFWGGGTHQKPLLGIPTSMAYNHFYTVFDYTSLIQLGLQVCF